MREFIVEDIKQSGSLYSVHRYLSTCCLSFTSHFLNRLQYLMIMFSCVFHYPNSLI